MNETHVSFVHNRILKFQVGFLLVESKGFSSETVLDVPHLRVAEDLDLEYLKGTLRFSRTSRGILVQGTLNTALMSECTRCLDETINSMQVTVEEIFVYPPEAGAEFVVPETGLLDLAPLLREEVFLLIPINTLCRPDCAGLCATCGHNLNRGPCGCPSEDIDPRFAALKSLKGWFPEE